MDLIKIIKDTIIDKKNFIGVYIFNTILLTIFSYLLSWSIDALYAIVLSSFVLLMYLIYECYCHIEFKRKLKDAEVSPDYYGDYRNSTELEVFKTVSRIHSKYNEKVYTMRNKEKNKSEIFSTYIHDMKTSVTVVNLAMNKLLKEQGENKVYIDIKDENEKLGIKLETALNILRLEEFDKDYITEKTELNKFIKSIINNNKKLFIYNGIFPIVKINNDISVHTDLKWCEYMIEQVLSNSIKYSNKNEDKNIFVTASEDNERVILKIKDEGVGIPKEEISRVFQAFYTGKNGRSNKKSTGIGLYMVKTIGEKLNHNVSISSIEGKGTEVNIEFRKLSKM